MGMLNKVYLWRNLNFTRMSQGQMEAQATLHGVEGGLRRWERPWFATVVFWMIAVIYVVNRSPYVGFNDGLSFLLAAETGFDPATNATSHFLYNNLQHILLKVNVFLPPVLILTLFSVGCAMGTLWVVYRIARLLTPSTGLALIPVVVLGMSFTYWQQAEIIEVYAFNNLIFSLFVYFALKDIVARGKAADGQVRYRTRYDLLVSLCLGIGLLTHIQHILSIPFFLVYSWGARDLPWERKLLAMLPWMACMSLLFILPAVNHTNTLKSVFFESKFQDELLGMDGMALLKGLLLGLGMVVYNFHLALIPILRGWRRMWQVQRRVMFLLLVLGLPYLAFAAKYAVNDNHVFYLCFYMVLVLPMVHAFESPRWKSALGWLFPAAFVVPVLLYAAATLLAPQVPALKQYDAEKAYKGGVVHLLWPGKAWAQDPLAIVERRVFDGVEKPEDRVEEWNYEAAVKYVDYLQITMD
jgi:hypothetical protein